MKGRQDARAFGARFESVSRRLGDRPALVGDGRTLDYATLESTTRAMAARIDAAAAGRPGFVALLFSRKTLGVQAMLAALRCGRAYVPLDDGDPDERLRFVLRDCAPAVLLVEHDLAARARALAEANCIVVEVDGGESPDPSFALPDVSPDALAYVLYTSGSTGMPKGVTQTQRGILFFADAFLRRLAVVEDDRMSLLFSPSFAAANMAVHGGFTHGLTVCAYDMRRDGIPGLARWLERERISVIHTIPTVFRELVATLAPGEKLAHVRAINVGGEAAFPSDVASFLEHTGDGAIFVNHLASTEADVIAQLVVTHRDTPPAAAILPVGRPTDGVEVRIRRDDGSDAEVGEDGAIVVSSPHLSPGYWQRPDLDAQYFPADPRHPGARCYVSGDRGHIDAEGNVHFLGRAGTRIKIRGHSVDLTEVEAALAALPGVVRCAALAPSPEQGKEANRIVAYLTVAAPADAAELRRQLGDRLPPYMLPSAFVFLDAFPTTTTGKIDRIALAMHAPASAPRERLSGGATDKLELAVAGIFEHLLKVSPVGRRDDFFLLGGDSLLASELQNRLRDAFGFDVPQLHRHSTVEAVAAAIRAHRASVSKANGAVALLVPLRTEGSRPPLFLVHGRMGQAHVSPHFLSLLGAEQPVYAFRARGLDGDEPHATIEEMASDYAAAIWRIQPHGPYLIGGLCAGSYVAMEIARRLRASGEPVLPLLLIDPPRRGVVVHASSMTEGALLARLRVLQVTNVDGSPAGDPAFKKASVRVARAIEDAIARFRPQPYDGPVCMLLASERLAIMPLEKWRKFFSGEIQQSIVADTHDEALDAKTPAFREALAKAMERIYRDLPEAH